MFSHIVNKDIELRLFQPHHGSELFKVIHGSRQHLRAWHPWVDLIRSSADTDRLIAGWLQQLSRNRGFCAGIWFERRLCGSINHLNVDWVNRSTAFSYWLDERHQGRGIMTASCRAFVKHAFNTLQLNRVTIECVTENARSRRIPERLGFQLEGVFRGVEWLHDRFADHAVYSLLKGDRGWGNAASEGEILPKMQRAAGACLEEELAGVGG
jgi:ribosomal-protein-serine acetyltransferase